MSYLETSYDYKQNYISYDGNKMNIKPRSNTI